jgi:hypothetical protein
MPKYKPAFKIGDWVKVNTISVIEYDVTSNSKVSKNKVLKRCRTNNIVGQICGAVYRYEGEIETGWYESPTIWTAKKSHLLWQVRTCLTAKPVEALEKDIELTDEHSEVLPFRGRQYKWNERERSEMREVMKHWPRSENGRWKSATEMTSEERKLIGI